MANERPILVLAVLLITFPTKSVLLKHTFIGTVTTNHTSRKLLNIHLPAQKMPTSLLPHLHKQELDTAGVALPDGGQEGGYAVLVGRVQLSSLM